MHPEEGSERSVPGAENYPRGGGGGTIYGLQSHKILEIEGPQISFNGTFLIWKIKAQQGNNLGVPVVVQGR